MQLNDHSMKYNVLIVYWHNAPSIRITTEDHLLCFERYLPHYCYYLNLADEVLPAWVHRVKFDIIVFHDLFFCGRWGGRPLFEKLSSRIDFLRGSNAFKIAIPQDEFISADLLCEFINSFAVQAVFSVAPPSEWPKIYRDVDRERVKFYCVLTGYLEDTTLSRIEAIVSHAKQRTTDIGYRAGGRSWRQASWLGRHGTLKIEIADLVEAEAPKHNLKVDISTRSEDTFMGDAWYQFLAGLKYTIGLEGGASVLDWDGTIRVNTLEYVERHPQASFEEIEAACFPGLDGQFALFALSPRHLEACATRTCQILIEGNYNGVLLPWRHYLPLKRDMSNLFEILEIARQDSKRESIVETAYQDIVVSGRYTYNAFVQFILAEVQSLEPRLNTQSHGSSPSAAAEHANYLRSTKTGRKDSKHLSKLLPIRMYSKARFANLLSRGWSFFSQLGERK
jgi:hypothetical protein